MFVDLVAKLDYFLLIPFRLHQITLFQKQNWFEDNGYIGLNFLAAYFIPLLILIVFSLLYISMNNTIFIFLHSQ